MLAQISRKSSCRKNRYIHMNKSNHTYCSVLTDDLKMQGNVKFWEKNKSSFGPQAMSMSNRIGKGDEVRGCLHTFFPPFRFLHYPLGIMHSSSVQTIRIWPLYVYKYLTKRFIVLSNQIIEGSTYTWYLILPM